ncbi:MAG: hypothetical protein O7F12_02965 [Nitrospirae bacterium]|nr:hypothetical protein [Nitrospirota bacterium]
MFFSWPLILFISLGFLGCQTSSIVEIPESQNGCTGVLPVAALSNKEIDVELASLIVQEVSLGNFKVEYSETMEALLSSKVLDRWVKEEMICQGAKTFKEPEKKIWFLSMKEVSEKSSAQEFISWLKENPIENFTKPIQTQKLEGEATLKFVSGKIILPETLKLATIEALFRNGELYVPGPTTVIIDFCSGLVKHHRKAKVFIVNAFSSCVQEQLEE